jgi:hypothetical protein
MSLYFAFSGEINVFNVPCCMINKSRILKSRYTFRLVINHRGPDTCACAMIASDQRTLYVRPSTAAFPRLTSADLSEVRKTLESGPDAARIATLQALIMAAVNGERELMNGLLMTLIRFVLPLKDKAIKKLLLLLFENIVKVDSDGNLKQEFILVW